MSTRVLAMNERDVLPLDIARADLLHILDAAGPITLGGLAEWNAVRDHILDACGLSWTRGPHGGGPVLWDETRHTLHAVRSRRLSGAEFVGHLIGRRDRLGPSWCTEAILDDLPGVGPDGSQTVVLNFHLTAEVQDVRGGGGYKKGAKYLLRVMRHKREKRRLGRLARRHVRRGRTVYAIGDTNFDGLQLGGFVNCWDGHSGGDLGGRAVTIVFADRRPSSAPQTYKTHSDHLAVAVTY